VYADQKLGVVDPIATPQSPRGSRGRHTGAWLSSSESSTDMEMN